MKRFILILALGIVSIGLAPIILHAAGGLPAVIISADKTEINAGESVTLMISTIGIPTSMNVTSTGGTLDGHLITFNVPGTYTVTVTAYFAGYTSPFRSSVEIIVRW